MFWSLPKQNWSLPKNVLGATQRFSDIWLTMVWFTSLIQQLKIKSVVQKMTMLETFDCQFGQLKNSITKSRNQKFGDQNFQALLKNFQPCNGPWFNLYHWWKKYIYIFAKNISSLTKKNCCHKIVVIKSCFHCHKV